MKSLRDGWYVAETDDYADGPMTRDELAARQSRGDFAANALAWHTELGEWRPLSRLLQVSVAQHAGATPPARPVPAARAAPAAGTAARPLSKAERKAMRKAMTPPASTATPRPATQDDGRRLLSHANIARSIAKAGANPGAMQHSTPATMPGAKAAAPAKPDAAKSGAALLEAIRRLFARSIDTLTMGAAVAIGLWSVAMDHWQRGPELEEWLAWPPSGFVLLWLALFAMIPAEALSLAIAGTTPGKALLGLSIVRRDGTRPNFAQTFARSVQVFWRGLAVGLPVIAFFTILVAGVAHMNKGRTTWDDRLGLEARAAPLTGGRWQLALVVLIVAWVAFGSGFWQELLVQTRR